MTTPAAPLHITSPPAGSGRQAHWLALAGNPNSGKTTLFNALTGLRQKVGNYAGVTVEKKVGRMFNLHGQEVQVLDLPGTYSLSVRSPDEKVARDVLLGTVSDTPRPELIVCVADANNLERSLYLTSQILDLNLPVILVLNMMDLAKAAGVEIDIKNLESLLGVPIIPVVASKEVGLIPLKQAITRELEKPPARTWTLPVEIESEVQALALEFEKAHSMDNATAFANALAALSEDEHTIHENFPKSVHSTIVNAQAKLEATGLDWRDAMVESRYTWIQSICAQVVKQGDPNAVTMSEKIDHVLTHKVWGWITFLGMMSLMFFTIFTVAIYPMQWIEALFGALQSFAGNHLPVGVVRDLICSGVISGVGSVVIFLPQILILFFFIGLLEDTGYMARAAFLMDRLMNRVGLHGKSFIPLLCSFACAIPGVMAARTIENPKDRLVTIMIAPLMSCSARLPVYTIMIATMFPTDAVSNWQKALIMLGMYLLGALVAFALAWLFKKTLMKGRTPVLIMELPPYRIPAIKTVSVHLWNRASTFIRRAGTVILALSIVLWVLMTYPKTPDATPSVALANSVAGKIGHAIEPVIAPLGFDWRIGIGLVGSFAAREIFVSTMGMVFNIEDADETSPPLKDAFNDARRVDGTPLFTPAVCISLMVFYVLAMQCVSTVAVVRRETNSWRWPIFQIFYMTGLAYIGSFIAFNAVRFFFGS